ncbi:MAG TPA: hypothetical protein VIM73_11855 [Polyangiaceae bacterium]
MSGGLLTHGDGPPSARCSDCGVLAVGPCARCRRPVCGDCCVLTTGGASTWAICLECERRGGSSLRSGWWQVIGWFAVPILVLLGLSVLLYVLLGA